MDKAALEKQLLQNYFLQDETNTTPDASSAPAVTNLNDSAIQILTAEDDDNDDPHATSFDAALSKYEQSVKNHAQVIQNLQQDLQNMKAASPPSVQPIVGNNQKIEEPVLIDAPSNKQQQQQQPAANHLNDLLRSQGFAGMPDTHALQGIRYC